MYYTKKKWIGLAEKRRKKLRKETMWSILTLHRLVIAYFDFAIIAETHCEQVVVAVAVHTFGLVVVVDEEENS